MPYRSGFRAPESRIAATVSAIIPASIAAGLVGTTCLMFTYVVAAILAGALSEVSLEILLSLLVVGGGAIALGTMAGTFVVAFHLLLFGLPLALLLGELIRTPAGLAISLALALAASFLVTRMLWGFPSISYAESLLWEEALVALCFALPAGWFYRQQVIAMLDELPD